MKSEWKKVRLGDFAKFQEGYVNPSQREPSFFGGRIKWLRAADINNSFIYDTDRKLSEEGYLSAGRSAKLFKPETLVISKSGTIGRIGILKDYMAGNRATINITPKEEVHRDFLFYTLLYKQNEIQHLAVGSVQRNLYISNLETLRFMLPPFKVQKHIASTLSCLDAKIENNNKIIETLEQQAQAIFKSWFVDFEPFQDGEFVESELGLIPKGWKVKSLDVIADYINGLAMQKYRPKLGKPGLPVLKIRELRQQFTDDNSDRCTSDIDTKFLVNDGDIIFSWSGSLLVDLWVGGPAGLNQHLFKVISKDYPKWFYYYWTKFHLEQFQHIAKSRATTMGHIRRSHLSDAKVLVCPPKKMEKMSGLMDSLISIKIVKRQENKMLANLRDTLLPKLMSGEIEVPVD